MSYARTRIALPFKFILKIKSKLINSLLRLEFWSWQPETDNCKIMYVWMFETTCPIGPLRPLTMKALYFRNVGNRLPLDAALHSTRTESSVWYGINKQWKTKSRKQNKCFGNTFQILTQVAREVGRSTSRWAREGKSAEMWVSGSIKEEKWSTQEGCLRDLPMTSSTNMSDSLNFL